MAETVNVEVKEQENSNPQQAQAAEAAEKAENHADTATTSAMTAVDAADRATEAAETATAAATVAVEKAEQAEAAQQQTYLSESVVNALRDSLELAVRRIEQIADITKETANTVEQLATELRATLELHQDQIGTLDDAANKLVKATAALVKLHSEQTAKQ
jgi:hypothetical protein